MIWRHLMLAVPDVDFVPAYAFDRVDCIVRGLRTQVELFSGVYEPEIARRPTTREQLEGHTLERVGEHHRRLERHGDTPRDQELKVRASVRWDCLFDAAVVRQVLRHRSDVRILPASQVGAATPWVPAYWEARLIETCPPLLLRTPNVYSNGGVVAAVDPLHAFESPPELDEAIIGAAKAVAYALADAGVRVFHAVSALPTTAGAARVGGRRFRLGTKRGSQWSRLESVRYRLPTQRDGRRCACRAGRRRDRAPVIRAGSSGADCGDGAVSRSYPQRAYFGHTAERVR